MKKEEYRAIAYGFFLSLAECSTEEEVVIKKSMHIVSDIFNKSENNFNKEKFIEECFGRYENVI